VHLVELLLPLYDNAGRPHPPAHFQAVYDELTEQFVGLTAHTRAPAEGLWKEGADAPMRDDVVTVEVMADALDAGWWADYRRRLEARFRQEVLVVRAHEVRLL
jgi:hypothetical protein